MSIPASNLVTGETYEVLRRGETKAIGKFTGKREGILGNPVMMVGDIETSFSPAQHSFKKAVKGGRRKTRRNCRRSSRSSRR